MTKKYYVAWGQEGMPGWKFKACESLDEVNALLESETRASSWRVIHGEEMELVYEEQQVTITRPRVS